MNLLIVGAAANVTDHLFVEALHLKARDLLNPGLELRSALWIIKARQFLCGVKQPRFYDAGRLSRDRARWESRETFAGAS